MPSTKTDTIATTFYASLDPKDKIIHDLAAKMLKTRYDPKRSNAYMKWTAKAKEQKSNA